MQAGWQLRLRSARNNAAVVMPEFIPPLIAPLTQHQVTVFGDTADIGQASPNGHTRPDMLAAEVPVALVFNGISHAVMMATPQDLEDFALGFALSEGIVSQASEVRGIDVVLADASQSGLPSGMAAIEVQVEVSARSFEQLKAHRRVLAGRTGCGVCGVESLAALDLTGEPVASNDWAGRIDAPRVLHAFSQLPSRQTLNAESGALHAAGWAALNGELLEVFEDVGRHNALDKLLGRMATKGLLDSRGFVIMSSRASHELVRKCARLNLSALATISAPTAMGVRMAELSGIRLWGLCRAPRAVLYAGGGEFLAGDSTHADA